MTKKSQALAGLGNSLKCYGICDVHAPQETREHQYLADAVRQFLETRPTVNQIEAVDAILHAGQLAACITAATNIRMSKESGLRK